MFLTVAEFHTAFGVFSATQPGLPSEDIRNLRVSLLTEEINEFIESDRENDLVNCAKELADIAYIICGTALVYGIAPEGRFFLPLANVPGVPAWPTSGLRAICITALQNLYKLYLAAETADDLDEIKAILMKLLATVGDVSYVYGYEFAPIFAEVHSSNMSKLDEFGNVLKRADGKVLKSDRFRKADIKSLIEAAQNKV